MGRTGTDATGADLRVSIRAMMDRHWDSAGYTVPNSETYPWLWLWDSCFHALVWLELEEVDRAVSELVSVFISQDSSGFVPHMGYLSDPDASVEFWGRRGASSITQPPMFGHAVAELTRAGVDCPAELLAAAEGGLRFLLEQRHRHSTGLVLLAHPWESGVDDSPRWDSACPGGYSKAAWYDAKGAWVQTIERSGGGAPLGNPAFAVASVGFNALLAFNALELATTGAGEDLVAPANELIHALAGQWRPELQTWADAGTTDGGSASIRTADALLASLVDTDAQRVAAVGELLLDGSAYGGLFGPAGVHRAEPTFDPRAYWRGAAWPQLSYLLALAQVRAGNRSTAKALAQRLRAGAATSGLAEYWDPDDGSGLGAIPQSWAGVALLMDGQ